jgi:hypothetical protein
MDKKTTDACTTKYPLRRRKKIQNEEEKKKNQESIVFTEEEGKGKRLHKIVPQI